MFGSSGYCAYLPTRLLQHSELPKDLQQTTNTTIPASPTHPPTCLAQHSELPKDLQQLQTPFEFYLKDTLDVSSSGFAVALRVLWFLWFSGRLAASEAKRWPAAWLNPTPPPPPLPVVPVQLVKLESDERLALGAGKPYERHLP